MDVLEERTSPLTFEIFWFSWGWS